MNGPMNAEKGPEPTSHPEASLRWETGLRATVTLLGCGIMGAVLLSQPQGVRADGGTLRAANVPVGSYRISVYTDPTPIPPDTVDVSVLATFERGRGLAPGLEIEVVARAMDGSGTVIRHPATREQAEDPRYYAAKFALGSAGEWEMSVTIRGPEGEGEIRFLVSVQEPGLFNHPFLVIGFALFPLVLVGWWLRHTRPETLSGVVS